MCVWGSLFYFFVYWLIVKILIWSFGSEYETFNFIVIKASSCMKVTVMILIKKKNYKNWKNNKQSWYLRKKNEISVI